MRLLLRTGVCAAMLGLLSGCFTIPDLRPASVFAPASTLGDFALGYNVVDAQGATFGPFSHDVAPGEIKTQFQAAIADRLGVYAGAGKYHVGVKVDAISLTEKDAHVAQPLRSVAVLSVSVWDDSTGEMLTDEPELLIVQDAYDAKLILGRGSTASAAKKLDRLSQKTALRLEQWLKENGQWFGAAPSPAAPEDLDAAEAAFALLVPEGGSESTQ